MPPSKKSKMSFAVSQEYCIQAVDKQCSNYLGREESSFRFQFAAGIKRPQNEKRFETRSKSLRLQSNLPNNEETSQSSTKSERDINIITQFNDSSMDITADRSIQDKAPDCSDLLRVLAPISDMWDLIGFALDIDNCIIKGLKRNEVNDKTRLAEILQAWIDKSDNVTWETIIQAIEGPIVNKKALAKEIRDKYSH